MNEIFEGGGSKNPTPRDSPEDRCQGSMQNIAVCVRLKEDFEIHIDQSDSDEACLLGEKWTTASMILEGSNLRMLWVQARKGVR